MQVGQNKTEAEILQLALEAFRKTVFPVQADVEVLDREIARTEGVRPELVLNMILKGKKHRFIAEVKNTLPKAQRQIMIMQRERMKDPLLLVTRYANPVMAEELRQNGIEFIDTAGNAFIDRDPVHIFVKGNKLREKPGRTAVKRIFKAAGLKMIYAFLCDPGLVEKTYRDIAAGAGVALGTVDRIMRELKELGFILDLGKQGFRLVRKEDLLQRWVIAYPEQFRPKLVLGCYKGEPGWWEKKRLLPKLAQWGGEVAAERITQYLKPELITIYTDPKHLNKVLLENKLRQDEVGNVEVLERFWKQNANRPEETVPPLLIYTDLLATGAQRNLEAAKLIYDKYLVQLIGKD